MKKINIFLRKNKKLIALFLVATFLVSVPQVSEQYFATSSKSKQEEAEKKKQQAEDKLKDVQDEMEDIEDKQDVVADELKDTRKQLSQLMDKQKTLKSEITSTQATIDQTQAELEVARDEAQKQYEAMKLRIQFMYENSGNDSIWMALLESDGIADMLNRVEYISTIYTTDKELTEAYKATVDEVEEKEELLLSEMDDLLVKQETFLGQQLEIEAMAESLEDTHAEYEDELASAQEQADEYKEIIKIQEEIIRKEKEEMKKKQEEGASSYEGAQDVSGETLVNYAKQFVGNPYVWGGNSLTKGCDCSGFVHQVYKYFGYDLVRYSMSFLYEGTEVDRADIKPGDIVVYARNKSGIGHVAIYAGNGKIVEAQSKKAGITDNRSIDCRTIVGIRRVLPNP